MEGRDGGCGGSRDEYHASVVRCPPPGSKLISYIAIRDYPRVLKVV